MLFIAALALLHLYTSGQRYLAVLQNQLQTGVIGEVGGVEPIVIVYQLVAQRLVDGDGLQAFAPHERRIVNLCHASDNKVGDRASAESMAINLGNGGGQVDFTQALAAREHLLRHRAQVLGQGYGGEHRAVAEHIIRHISSKRGWERNALQLMATCKAALNQFHMRCGKRHLGKVRTISKRRALYFFTEAGITSSLILVALKAFSPISFSEEGNFTLFICAFSKAEAATSVTGYLVPLNVT